METTHPTETDQTSSSYDFSGGDFGHHFDETPRELSQQELLEANVELFAHTSAIPVLNRLRFLVGDEGTPNRTSNRYTDLDELAIELKTDLETLVVIINDLNISPEMTPVDEFGNMHLAPYLDLVIAEELAWRKTYSELPDEVTAGHTSRVFNLNRHPTQALLSSYGIIPRTEQRSTAPRQYYPKALLHRIRVEIMTFPPARKNLTLNRIIGNIGCGHTWATSHLPEEYIPDLMRTKEGKIEEHYAPTLEDYLSSKYHKFCEATEDMYSVPQIADLLGRDVTWVNSRLPSHYRSKKLLRTHGQPRRFYGKDVLADLQKQSNDQLAIPLISDQEVTITRVVRQLKTNCYTVERILRELDIEPFKRRDANIGKIVNACSADLLVPIAEGIINDRKQKIAEHNAVILELSKRERHTLTPEERKQLRVANQQIASIPALLQHSEEIYRALIAETNQKDQD